MSSAGKWDSTPFLCFRLCCRPAVSPLFCILWFSLPFWKERLTPPSKREPAIVREYYLCLQSQAPPTHGHLVWSPKINSCTVTLGNKINIDQFLAGLAKAPGVYLMTKVESVPSPKSEVGSWVSHAYVNLFFVCYCALGNFPRTFSTRWTLEMLKLHLNKPDRNYTCLRWGGRAKGTGNASCSCQLCACTS